MLSGKFVSVPASKFSYTVASESAFTFEVNNEYLVSKYMSGASGNCFDAKA